MHHFDGAAGEAKGHGPEGALAGPVGDLIKCCSVLVEAGLVIWGLRLVKARLVGEEKKDMYVCVMCIARESLGLMFWK